MYNCYNLELDITLFSKMFAYHIESHCVLSSMYIYSFVFKYLHLYQIENNHLTLELSCVH